jgi:hypothetical protein
MLKLIRLLRFGWPCHIAAAHTIIDAPEPLPWLTAFRRMLLSPPRHFHLRSSQGWTVGYCFYHSAILMVVSGYAVSCFIVLAKLAAHAPILDFASGALVAKHTTVSNILAIIFGNAEKLPSIFLFGSWAPWFRTLGWCELPLAIIGNVCLLYTLFHRRLYGTIWIPPFKIYACRVHFQDNICWYVRLFSASLCWNSSAASIGFPALPMHTLGWGCC